MPGDGVSLIGELLERDLGAAGVHPALAARDPGVKDRPGCAGRRASRSPPSPCPLPATGSVRAPDHARCARIAYKSRDWTVPTSCRCIGPSCVGRPRGRRSHGMTLEALSNHRSLRRSSPTGTHHDGRWLPPALRSARTARAALRPGSPVTPPPGWAPAPAR